MPQAVVNFGGQGIARNDPDFMAAYIVNHILGGGSFSSRLYREVREKRGLAYGVSDSLVWFKRAAVVIGGTATRADRTGEALAIIERRPSAWPRKADRRRAGRGEIVSSRAPMRSRSIPRARSPRQLTQIQIDNLGIDYISAPRRPDRRRHHRRRQAGGQAAATAAACWSPWPAGQGLTSSGE